MSRLFFIMIENHAISGAFNDNDSFLLCANHLLGINHFSVNDDAVCINTTT